MKFLSVFLNNVELVWILVLSSLLCEVTCQDDDHMSRLIKKLFKNYQATNSVASKTPLQLYVDIPEIFVNNIPAERSNTITLNVYLYMRWTDQRLVWNPSDYNAITKIIIPSNKIWIPDLTVYTKSVKDFLKKDEYNALVFNNGTILFIPAIEIPMYFNVPLKTVASGESIKVTNYLGLWTMSNLECKLSSSNVSIARSFFSWDLKLDKNVVSSKYPCCPDEYEKLELTLTATRQASGERRLLGMPNLLFAVLAPVFLFISPRKNARILSVGLNILAILVYAHHASKTGGFVIPTGCLNGSLLINIIVLVWSIISGLLWTMGSYSAGNAEIITLKIIKNIFCLPNPTIVNKSEDNEKQDDKQTSQNLPYYHQLSLILDRVAAVFLLVVAIIFAIYHGSG